MDKCLWRFGRNLRDVLTLFDYFEKDCGVGLISIQEQFDTTTAMGRFVRNVLTAMYELEREVIRERILAGKAEKRVKAKEKGQRAYIEDRPPYGWDAVDGELVVNKTEQTIRRRIKRLYESGKSYSEIARALNEKGVLSKSNGKWCQVTVRDAMKNSRISYDAAYRAL